MTASGLIKEHTTNNILGIVAAQSMKYQSQAQGVRVSNADLITNNSSFT